MLAKNSEPLQPPFLNLCKKYISVSNHFEVYIPIMPYLRFNDIKDNLSELILKTPYSFNIKETIEKILQDQQNNEQVYDFIYGILKFKATASSSPSYEEIVKRIVAVAEALCANGSFE